MELVQPKFSEEEVERLSKEQRLSRLPRKYLKKEYQKGQKTAPLPEVMDANEFRKHILSMSLFPNIYNRKMMMTSLDSSM